MASCVLGRNVSGGEDLVALAAMRHTCGIWQLEGEGPGVHARNEEDRQVPGTRVGAECPWKLQTRLRFTSRRLDLPLEVEF